MTVGRLTRRGFLAAVPALAAACAAPAVPGAAASAASTPAPTAPATTPPATAAAAPAGGPARELVHATSGRPEIALTFHGAGDLDLARKILTGLAARGAAATVLAVGTWLAQYPDAARLVSDNGHELGNHTWSHPNLTSLADAGIRAEIERCRDRIAALTGGPGAFFRPSAAQHATPEVLRLAGAAGYATVLSYDVDSRDFTDPGAAAVRRVVGKARRRVGRQHASGPPRHPGRPAGAPRRPRPTWTATGHRERAFPMSQPEPRREQVPQPVRLTFVCAVLAVGTALAGCAAPPHAVAPSAGPTTTAAPTAAQAIAAATPVALLPGMPPVTDPHDIYADAGAGMLSAVAKTAKPLVYVPHTKTGEVWTIDPTTFAVVGRYRLGGELQHVIPSWDMTTLYASNDTGDQLTPFDPGRGCRARRSR